jgi:hypothetical protein
VSNEVRCYHSHQPASPRSDLEAGQIVRAVVVCVHAYGLGVWLPEHAVFGHVNAPHMGVPHAHTLDDYPTVGAVLTTGVLGYSGVQHQLRLEVVILPEA